MDSDQFSCIVCRSFQINHDHLCNKWKGFRDAWKLLLDLFRLNHSCWADIEGYLEENNLTPFCDQCMVKFNTLLTLSQTSDETLIFGRRKWKSSIETGIKQAIIESEESPMSIFGCGTSSVRDNSLEGSAGDVINNRISSLRKCILIEFTPNVLLRDCRSMIPSSTSAVEVPPQHPSSLIINTGLESTAHRKQQNDYHNDESLIKYRPKDTRHCNDQFIPEKIKTERIYDYANVEGTTLEMQVFDDSCSTSVNGDPLLYSRLKYSHKKTKRKKLLTSYPPVILKERHATNCELCDGQSFTKTSNLIRHIQRVHKRIVLKPKPTKSMKSNKCKMRPDSDDKGDGKLEYGGWEIKSDGTLFYCICGVTDSQIAGVRAHIQTQHLADRNPDQFPVKGGGDKSKPLGNGKFVYKDIYLFECKDDGRFLCLTCSVHTPRKKDMVSHIKTKHTPESCRFYCKHCNLGFSSRQYFLRHEKRHKAQRWWEITDGSYVYDNKFKFDRVEDGFKCGTCDLILKKFYFMTPHIRDVHANPEGATCSTCGRVFGHRRHYWKHMNTCTKKDFQVLDPGSQTRLLYRSKFEVEVFTESDPGDGEGLKVRYKCVTCLHERNRRSAMFRHIRMKHIDRIALACTECEKTFDDSDNLKQHMISHSNIRPFVCQLGLCTKRFKTKAALGSHQKNCSVKCGKILGSSVKIR